MKTVLSTFSAPGMFQMWNYTPSHGRLLLRRVISESFRSRIDILFVDTIYVGLPTKFHGLSIVEMGSDLTNASNFLVDFNQIKDRKIYKVDENGRGLVIASYFLIAEDSGAYDEASSIDY